MKKAEKFTTFDELKSSESETVNAALTMKKHSEFEKVIREIMSVNLKKAHQNTAKH